jgi:hypothetical protein
MSNNSRPIDHCGGNISKLFPSEGLSEDITEFGEDLPPTRFPTDNQY